MLSDNKIKQIPKACTYLGCHLYPCLVFVCIIFFCCSQRHTISSGTFSLAAFCSMVERSALSSSSILKHSFSNLSLQYFSLLSALILLLLSCFSCRTTSSLAKYRLLHLGLMPMRFSLRYLFLFCILNNLLHSEQRAPGTAKILH